MLIGMERLIASMTSIMNRADRLTSLNCSVDQVQQLRVWLLMNGGRES